MPIRAKLYLGRIILTYGHLAGDVVISGIGAIIRQVAQEYDIAARLAGDAR